MISITKRIISVDKLPSNAFTLNKLGENFLGTRVTRGEFFWNSKKSGWQIGELFLEPRRSVYGQRVCFFWDVYQEEITLLWARNGVHATILSLIDLGITECGKNRLKQGLKAHVRLWTFPHGASHEAPPVMSGNSAEVFPHTSQIVPPRVNSVRWSGAPKGFTNYELRITNYDLGNSAPLAQSSGADAKVVNEITDWNCKKSVRSYVMPNPPLCWIVNGLWPFRLTSFIQRKRMRKRVEWVWRWFYWDTCGALRAKYSHILSNPTPSPRGLCKWQTYF